MKAAYLEGWGLGCGGLPVDTDPRVDIDGGGYKHDLELGGGHAEHGVVAGEVPAGRDTRVEAQGDDEQSAEEVGAGEGYLGEGDWGGTAKLPLHTNPRDGEARTPTELEGQRSSHSG